MDKLTAGQRSFLASMELNDSDDILIYKRCASSTRRVLNTLVRKGVLEEYESFVGMGYTLTDEGLELKMSMKGASNG